MKLLKRIGLVVLLLAIIAGGAFGAYKYRQVVKQNQQLKNPQAAAQAETSSLVAEVSKVAALPQGETPTIATVVDASKLQSQAFFKNAQNGDKVLMYTKALKAYLYRPSSHLIIEIAPITIGPNQGANSATPGTTKK